MPFLAADPRLFSTITIRPRYWDSIRQSYRPTMTIGTVKILSQIDLAVSGPVLF